MWNSNEVENLYCIGKPLENPTLKLLAHRGQNKEVEVTLSQNKPFSIIIIA